MLKLFRPPLAAWTGSALLHSAGWLVALWLLSDRPSPETQHASAASHRIRTTRPADVSWPAATIGELTLPVRPAAAADGPRRPRDAKAPVSSVALPAMQTLADSLLRSTSGPGLEDLVRQAVADAIQLESGQPADRQLQRLEDAARRLSSVASEKSVDEIAGFLNGALNTRREAADPADDQPFDPSTAQIDDVREETTAAGKTRYLARLKDRSGRTQEVEVEAEVGQQLVSTFGLMKKFPLLKAVYQKTVMGLLDQMLSQPPSPAEPAPPPRP